MRSSFGRPCRCAREAGAHAAGACCRRTRTRPHARAMSAPVPARLRRLRARLSATPLALAIGTCERAASPVLLTACALLPRCRQSQLREVGLDGHRALDISVMTGRRDVDTTVTPPAHPWALPHVPAKPVPVKPAPVKPVSLWPVGPGAVVLETAAPSAHCSTRSPSSTAPSTPSWSSAP